VNFKTTSVQTSITILGFEPENPAQIIELQGPLDARNTAKSPMKVIPKKFKWRHSLQKKEQICIHFHLICLL